jgi:hypothetical protein
MTHRQRRNLDKAAQRLKTRTYLAARKKAVETHARRSASKSGGEPLDTDTSHPVGATKKIAQFSGEPITFPRL